MIIEEPQRTHACPTASRHPATPKRPAVAVGDLDGVDPGPIERGRDLHDLLGRVLVPNGVHAVAKSTKLVDRGLAKHESVVGATHVGSIGDPNAAAVVTENFGGRW